MLDFVTQHTGSAIIVFLLVVLIYKELRYEHELSAYREERKARRAAMHDVLSKQATAANAGRTYIAQLEARIAERDRTNADLLTDLKRMAGLNASYLAAIRAQQREIEELLSPNNPIGVSSNVKLH